MLNIMEQSISTTRRAVNHKDGRPLPVFTQRGGRGWREKALWGPLVFDVDILIDRVLRREVAGKRVFSNDHKSPELLQVHHTMINAETTPILPEKL